MKKRIKEFRYWFEENVLNSIYKTMLVLFISTLIFVGIVSIIIFFIETIGTSEKNFFVLYCDNLFTAINAWYPEIPTGEEGALTTWKSYGFKVLVALFGLFFTSIIIGFISEKISSIFEDIRNNNRKIIENEHIVVLGYTFGDCKVVEELMAMTSKRIVIVVADNSSKSEIYEDIKARLDIPKNVKLIIQSIDITDYNMLEYCSIEKSRAVIINILDDNKNSISSITYSC